MNYYVYILLNSAIPGKFEYSMLSMLYEPFYVGKASGTYKRENKHLLESQRKNAQNIVKEEYLDELQLNNGEVYIIQLECNTEIEAFNLEESLISEIGRIIFSNGPLTNIQDGGPGKKGINYSERNRPYRSKLRKDKITIFDTKKKINFIVHKDVFEELKNEDPDRYVRAKWKRYNQNNNKSRRGELNGMFGAAPNKGKRWVTLHTEEVVMMHQRDIDLLDPNSYALGRIDFNNDQTSKKRIIVQGDSTSRWVTTEEIQQITKPYQFGLIWVVSKETFNKEKSNELSENKN